MTFSACFSNILRQTLPLTDFVASALLDISLVTFQWYILYVHDGIKISEAKISMF